MFQLKQTTPKPLMLMMGNNLKTIRTERGLSQSKLAKLSHVERTLIGKIEKGERSLSPQNICKLAIALDITPNELFEGYETILNKLLIK